MEVQGHEGYHQPVLLNESIELLAIKPGGTYVDATFGGGGHSRCVLEQLGQGRLISFDKDPDAQQNLPEDERITFVAQDFKFIESALAGLEVAAVDGILADLGISSHQIDTAHRGFSFRFEADLDMRMNPRQGLTAADLLNQWEEAALADLFYHYGEIPNARKLARQVVEHRSGAEIRTTTQLESAIRACIPRDRRNKYLAQVYQALRIEVNGELDALQALLLASLKLLKPGGRLAIIAYHSLEDRLTKRFLRSGKLGGRVEKDFYGNPLTPWNLITRRAVKAGEAEVAQNPRARSARLRVGERIEVQAVEAPE